MPQYRIATIPDLHGRKAPLPAFLQGAPRTEDAPAELVRQDIIAAAIEPHIYVKPRSMSI